MPHQRIAVEESRQVLRISLARPERNNSIDDTLLDELHGALDAAERAASCRVIVLSGKDGVFCTGLDFESVVDAGPGESPVKRGQRYLDLLKRFASIPRVVISSVDGRVAAGGVGLVAASDFVFATERASFSLPEALWGLLPCCVLPFLLRRTGFQRAYAMTLSTQPIGAAEAARCHLVDEVTADLDALIGKLAMRVNRLNPTTLGDAKRYFGALAGISAASERTALEEFERLISSSMVRNNIHTFVTTHRFPWEGADT